MHILLTLQFPQGFIDDLRSKLGEKHTLHVMRWNDPDIGNIIGQVDIIISGGWGVDTKLLDQAPNLKLLQIPWIGFDGLDFQYFIQRRIAVCNSKWNPNIVAEYAVALLLAGIKKFIPMHNTFSQGYWESRAWGAGVVRGKKVLLIGYGDIGQDIARMLSSFDCEIIALRKHVNEEQDIISWDDYDLIAPEVDYVIVSLPLTPETEGVLDERRLRLLKSGAYLVTVGRGKTIDEEAFYKVLKDKHLSGAAIDVWYNYNSNREPEPFYPSNYPFHELDNVIMSPHRASSIHDGREVIWDDLLENIERIKTGKPLKNQIDLTRGY